MVQIEHRTAAATLAVVQTLLAGGAVYGWGATVVLLKEMQAYSWLSEQDQQVALSVVWTVGSTCGTASSVVVGALMDAYGQRKVSMLGSLSFIIGALLLAFSSQDFVAFAPAYGFIGFAAPALLFTTFSTCNLFRTRSNSFMALLNGCFDASSVVFLALLRIVQAGAVTARAALIGYTLIILLPLALAQFFFSKDKPYERAAVAETRLVELSARTESAELGVHAAVESLPGPLPAGGAKEAGLGAAGSPPTLRARARAAVLRTLTLMLTPCYVSFVVFQSLGMMRFAWYLSTVDQVLNNLGQTAGEYSGVLATVMPLGCLFVPFTGYFIDRLGPARALYGVFVLELGVTLLGMVPSLRAQIATFIAFAAFRSLFFTATTAWVADFYGYVNFGTLFGFGVLVGSLINLTQAPALAAVLAAGGSFSSASYVFIAFSAAALVHPLFLSLRSRPRLPPSALALPPTPSKVAACDCEAAVAVATPDEPPAGAAAGGAGALPAPVSAEGPEELSGCGEVSDLTCVTLRVDTAGTAGTAAAAAAEPAGGPEPGSGESPPGGTPAFCAPSFSAPLPPMAEPLSLPLCP